MNRSGSNLGATVEADELDEYGDAGQLATETIHQIAARFHRAPGGQDVVDNQHPLTPDDRVGMHLQRVRSVF